MYDWDNFKPISRKNLFSLIALIIFEILKVMNAKIGKNVVIYPGVWIEPGYNLTIGDNVDISKDTCKLPDYPIQEFGLFKDNIKTKNANNTDNFCKVLKNAVFDISDEKIRRVSHKIDDEERKKFINRIGKDIFNKQKILLPELLTELREPK